MFNKSDQPEHNSWMSFTDLVTGFLVVFIVTTLVLLLSKKGVPACPPPPPPCPECPTITDMRSREATDVFKVELENNGNINLKNNAVRFVGNVENKELLFKYANDTIQPYFNELLLKFYPILIKQIKSIKNNGDYSIKEIRIEGHASKDKNKRDNFISNLTLSSNRALSVQKDFLKSNEFNSLDIELQSEIKQNLISIGYSHSKLLNNSGDRTIYFEEQNEDLSRRVEFRIIIEPIP